MCLQTRLVELPDREADHRADREWLRGGVRRLFSHEGAPEQGWLNAGQKLNTAIKDGYQTVIDYWPDSPEAIIELAREQTARAFAAAPSHFGRIPSANCEVRAVEEYREREGLVNVEERRGVVVRVPAPKAQDFRR
mgnify:CR=1 FL=1